MEHKIVMPTSFKIQATIDFVEARLEKPVTPKIFRSLMRKMEAAQKVCSDDKLNASIVTLYGKLISAYNDHIKDKVESIISLVQSENKQDCAQKRESCPLTLQDKILFLKKQEGLSRENWDLILQLENSFQNPSFSYKSWTSYDVVLSDIEELFALMNLFYYEEEEQKITLALHKLPYTTKQCLLKTLPVLLLSSGKFSRIQSLFATIYELAGTSWIRLPSEKEIDHFFSEQEEVLHNTEHKQTPIYSLAQPA